MPTYEYQCKVCGHLFEIVKKMSDTSVTECPACHKTEVERLLSAPNIQFKGTGWYVTDYKDKDKKKSVKENNQRSENQQDNKASSTAETENKSSTSETKSAESKSTSEK